MIDMIQPATIYQPSVPEDWFRDLITIKPEHEQDFMNAYADFLKVCEEYGMNLDRRSSDVKEVLEHKLFGFAEDNEQQAGKVLNALSNYSWYDGFTKCVTDRETGDEYLYNETGEWEATIEAVDPDEQPILIH